MKNSIIMFSLFYSSLILCSAPASTAQTQKKYSLQKRVNYPNDNLNSFSILKIRIKNHKDGHWIEQWHRFKKNDKGIWKKDFSDEASNRDRNSEMSKKKLSKMSSLLRKATSEWLSHYYIVTELKENEKNEDFFFNRIDLPYEVKKSKCVMQ